MSELVKVERKQGIAYVVNVPLISGGNKKWTWQAAKNGKSYVQSIPKDHYDWIVNNTISFELGELRLCDDQANKEELLEQISDVESYQNNSHTREEIINLLKKGQLTKIKKELGLITSSSEKKFVFDIFQEIKEDLVGSKINLVEEWYGVINKD